MSTEDLVARITCLNEAKKLENIKNYGIYEEVWNSEVPTGDRDRTMTTTWDVMEKDDQRTKDRVCVRGLQKRTSHRRDSLTATKVSQRLSLTQAVVKGRKVLSLDVSAAYLHCKRQAVRNRRNSVY